GQAVAGGAVDTLRLRGPGFDSRPVPNLVACPSWLSHLGTQPSWPGQNS
ncbi:hypothetical protein CHC_T00008358001, partial [Chondrus crispus]